MWTRWPQWVADGCEPRANKLTFAADLNVAFVDGRQKLLLAHLRLSAVSGSLILGQRELRLLAQASAHPALPCAGDDDVLFTRLEDDAARRTIDMVRELPGPGAARP